MNRYGWTGHRNSYPEGGQRWCEVGDCNQVCLNLFKSRTMDGKKWLCPHHHKVLQNVHDVFSKVSVGGVLVEPIPPPIMMVRE